MTTHFFHNPGPLNTLFLRSFGISAKSDDAIGQFGTGLKYAAAVILRSGGKVKITSAGSDMVLGTREERIRGAIHQIATITEDGATTDLPFATNLGKNWRPWMAFRELICNAWDEGGGYTANIHDIEALDPDTVISVTWKAFDEIDPDHYFYRDPAPEDYTMQGKELGITRNSRHMSGVFYKGVFVHGLDLESPMQFHLVGNHWGTSLTEDRQLDYLWRVDRALSDTVWKAGEEEVETLLIFLQRQSNGKMLHHISQPPEKWMDMILKLYNAKKLTHPVVSGWIRTWEEKQPPRVLEFTPQQEAALDRAKAFLAQADVDLSPYRLRLVAHNRTNVLGETSFDDNIISLTPKAFESGLRMVIVTLLEEYIHQNYKVPDHCYEFQIACHENFIKAVCKLTGEII